MASFALAAAHGAAADPAATTAISGLSTSYACTGGLNVDILYGGDGSVVLTTDEGAWDGRRETDGGPNVYSSEKYRWTLTSPKEGVLRPLSSSKYRSEMTCRAR